MIAPALMRQITEGKDRMEPKQIALAELADATLNSMSTAVLREWAKEHLEAYSLTSTVARFEMTSEVATAEGALTVIDKALATLRKAYSARGAHVAQRYSGLDLLVWQEDESLRHSLRYKRDQLIKEAEQADPDAE